MAIFTMDDGIVDRALACTGKAENVIPTGYDELDEKIEGGLQNSYLYVLGARLGMGKTAFALNIAANILKKGKKILWYCLRMPPEKIVKRMIITESRGEEDHMQQAADEIKKYGLILDTDRTFCIFGESYDEKISYDDVALIVIDDLQHISMPPEPEGICCALKETARKKDVPVLLLTDLSETLEERELTDRRPILPDLHDVYHGDSVAGYADVVMFLYRDEYYDPDTEMKGIAEVKVAKNVSGPSVTVKLVYIREFMKFANIERECEV